MKTRASEPRRPGGAKKEDPASTIPAIPAQRTWPSTFRRPLSTAEASTTPAERSSTKRRRLSGASLLRKSGAGDGGTVRTGDRKTPAHRRWQPCAKRQAATEG